MRPKTKIQVQIAALSRRLPKITREHKAWVRDNLLPHYIYRTLKFYSCFKCGKSWSVHKEPKLSYLLDDKCPHCGTWLTSLNGNPNSKKRTLRDRHYFYIALVFAEYQVLRYFCVERSCKVGFKMNYEVCEVYQNWINKQGKLTVMAIKRNYMGYFSQTPWVFGTDMEIRKDNDRYYEDGERYPGARFLKEIRRNGFKGQFHGLHPSWFFQLILSTPKAETLLKAKQYSLLRYFSRIEDLLAGIWPSIRICMRNHYIVTDASTWIDHLRILEKLDKDRLNPKYICPGDLRAEHQKLIKKERAVELKREAAIRRSQIEKENKAFRKNKQRFFGIRLEKGRFVVEVIDNVNDYYLEGKELNHCVYSSRYYEKPDTLCLSAKSGGKRFATIELSLKTWEILQCRGVNNKTPEKIGVIKDLVENNISLFKKRIRIHKNELIQVA